MVIRKHACHSQGNRCKGKVTSGWCGFKIGAWVTPCRLTHLKDETKLPRETLTPKQSCCPGIIFGPCPTHDCILDTDGMDNGRSISVVLGRSALWLHVASFGIREKRLVSVYSKMFLIEHGTSAEHNGAGRQCIILVPEFLLSCYRHR